MYVDMLYVFFLQLNWNYFYWFTWSYSKLIVHRWYVVLGTWSWRTQLLMCLCGWNDLGKKTVDLVESISMTKDGDLLDKTPGVDWSLPRLISSTSSPLNHACSVPPLASISRLSSILVLINIISSMPFEAISTVLKIFVINLK